MPLTKKERPVRWIPLKDLTVEWAQAQRELSERRVAKIMEEFDPDFVGILTVAAVDGEDYYHIIDGQHRAEAVRRLWGDSQRIECEIISGVDSPADAARVWRGRNTNQSKPTPLERFTVAVTEGNEVCIAISKIVDDMGFTIGRTGIQAVTGLQWLYKRHGEDGLRWVLGVIRDAWGTGLAGTKAHILRGLALFYEAHGEEADPERLAKNLAKRYTPERLLGTAKASAEILDGGVPEGVMRVAEQCYNVRLTANQRLSAA